MENNLEMSKIEIKSCYCLKPKHKCKYDWVNKGWIYLIQEINCACDGFDKQVYYSTEIFTNPTLVVRFNDVKKT